MQIGHVVTSQVQHNRHCGFRVFVVPDPRPPYRVRPKPPSKRAGRVGTRRAWKRRHPPFTRQEPAALGIDQAWRVGDVLYVRAAAYARLRDASAASSTAI